MNEQVHDDPRPSQYPPAREAWGASIILTLGVVLAFMDRNILSLFIVPIQRDLHLTDTEISLLIGFAFAVFNALFGLPVARWVDKGSRKTIAALGVAVWSLATASCALAGNFWQLFLGRVAVGAGEAAVTPCGVSLLADLFPPARRGAPMGVFYGGMFVGGGVAFILGGALWRQIGDRQVILPIVGQLHSWQAILIAVGALGLLVAPLTLMIREPQRLDGGRRVVSAGVPLGVVAQYYKTHARTLTGHNVGFCLQNFALHAGSAWLPTLLVRSHGWSIAQAGATFGAMSLILGPTGSTAAGLLADMLARRGRMDGKLIVSVGAALMCAGASALIALQPTTGSLMVGLACFSFFGAFSLPLGPGALQEIMPNAMRGQATAVYVAVTNLIAGGFAATAVALLTDFVFHDKNMLNVSFGIVGVIVCSLAALTLYSTLSSFRSTARSLRDAAEPPRRPVLPEAASSVRP